MKTIKDPALDSWENDNEEVDGGMLVMGLIGETVTPHETLKEVDQILKQHGLEIVIHEPTVALPFVHWGFTIEKVNQ